MKTVKFAGVVIVFAAIGFGLSWMAFDSPKILIADAQPKKQLVIPVNQTADEAESLLVVEKTVDGDTVWGIATFRIPVDEKIRMLHIDTPERTEKYYTEAGKALQDILTSAKRVSLWFPTPKAQRDRYGRLLAYLMADGKNVNLEMVRLGWARYYTKYGHSPFDKEFAEAEASAQKAKLGIWR